MSALRSPASPVRVARAVSARWVTPVIAATGVLIEAALIVNLLVPLWIGRRPGRITDWEPLSAMIGATPVGLARFALTLALWIGGYVLVLRLCRRPLPARARGLLVAFPLLFALTLVPTLPAASKDMYHYLMEGRLLVAHGLNPMTTPPSAVPFDPLFWVMSSWQEEPSRYGPVWTALAALPVLIAREGLVGATLVFKAIAVVPWFVAALLAALAARAERPGEALAAFVFVAWNPLFLFESAANAHNDAVMVAGLALALCCAARRAWAAAFPALALGALVKYLSGLAGPVLLVRALAGRADRARTRRDVAIGLALALLLTVVAYALVWAGPATFAAARGATGEALNSPGWLLREGLRLAGLTPRTAHTVMAVVMAATFVLIYGLALRAAWRGRDDRRALWRACWLALAGFLITASWWFWPWYVTWLLPPAALLAGARVTRLTVVWSAAALLAYIPITYRPLFWGEVPDWRMPFAAALVTFLPPLAAALWLWRDRFRPAAHPAVPPPPRTTPAS